MIENCQNKADYSGVCRCQITTYDKESEFPLGALIGAETSEHPLVPTQRPSSTGESGYCSSSRYCHKVGSPIQACRSAHPVPGARPDRRFPAGVRVKELFFDRRGGLVRRPCHDLVRDCENSGKLFPACSLIPGRRVRSRPRRPTHRHDAANSSRCDPNPRA